MHCSWGLLQTNLILFVGHNYLRSNFCKFHLLPSHLGSSLSTFVHPLSRSGMCTSIDFGSLSAQSFADLNPTPATAWTTPLKSISTHDAWALASHLFHPSSPGLTRFSRTSWPRSWLDYVFTVAVAGLIMISCRWFCITSCSFVYEAPAPE